MKTLAISTLVAVACTASAQAQITPTQPYLMAFHACEGQLCMDPRNHRIYLAESADGVAWTMVPGWVEFNGSVPDVIQRGRTIYIYSAASDPSRLWRHNLDTGISDRVFVQLSGLPSNLANWADPSLWVDEEGRLVLFMLYAPLGQGDPARCPPGVASCTKEILSATEVPGSNGTQFVVDPGDRATIALSGTSTASDPDIFFDGTQYVLYISHGPSTSVWTSPTLRGTYTQSTTLPNGLLSNNTGGVPAGYFDPSTMQYWTYAHVGQAGVSVIRRAVHGNLSQQIGAESWTTVMSGPSMGFSAATSVESPSFTLLTTDQSVPVEHPECSTLDPPNPLTFAVVGRTVTLVWGGAAGASSYVVRIGTSPGASDVLVGETGTPDTSVNVTNAPTGTLYIGVRGRNACGTGPASKEVSATIPRF